MTENQFLITPDLSEAVETGEQIPPGIYNSRVTKVELKTTRDMMSKYLRWELTLFGAGGDLAKFNNWKVYYNTMTSGKGAGMLKSFYKACTHNELTGPADFGLLIGSEIRITLMEGKPYNGEPSKFPEVKKVEAIVQ